MIPKKTENKILDTAQIVDVISDFVTLKRHGKEYAACCPFGWNRRSFLPIVNNSLSAVKITFPAAS